MKKNLLIGMVAIASLFATSCQNEIDSVSAEKTSTVSFKVETPEIKSRAFSDGKTATVLQYAVYDAAGNELEDLTVTEGEINLSTTVNLQLTTGNTYSVIFWAAAPNAPYTVDFAAKTMTVDYNNAVSNAENRDAFYKYHTFKVTGAQTETIELKRPFAQLNIGTNDFEASTKAGYTVTQSSVKVPVYTTLNMENGNVEGPVTGEFKLANIPVREVFPVQDYEYLAMNYLLVSAEKETVDVEFTYTDGDDAKTRTVGSVPVQRNYRTNIYGQLLTSDVDINVEIKPEYNEPAHEADALYHAAAFGGEVTLTEDVELKTPLNIQANMILNLNGKTISGAIAKGAGAVVNVAEGVAAKIDGGTINSTVENGDAAINNAGKLVLKGVTINGAPLADGGYSAYAVISSGNLVIEEGTVVSADRGCIKVTGAGETVINGGTFTNKDISPRTLTSHVVDVENGSTHKLTINGGTFQHLHADTSGGVVICNRTTGTVYVNGGNFSGGNYYGNNNLSDYGYGGTFAVTGGVYTANPAAKYLVAGYKAVATNGEYHILPAVVAEAAIAANVTAVTESTADVATALANDNNEATMFMWNDVAYIAKYGEVVITSAADEATTVRGVVENATTLTRATVAEGIEVVGNRTFRKCANLETVELPNTLTEIGPTVFQSCSKLANVTIPTSVTTIGEGAFAECTSLKSINIPNGITRLEKDVLRNTGLTSIEIPASVNYIGTYAFRDCESLTEVKILSTEFTIENNTFTNVAAPVPTMTIYVVNAEMKAYLDSTLTNYDKSYITVVVM